ncbi:MAG TPA: HAD-IIIA family hydrolase [Phycisphaeraceae bacterium]
MHRAVFLDRDNTLIHNDGDLGDPEQVRLIQGAASAIASLCGLGFRVVVVTNQGGVARGKYTEADVEAVHQRIRELVQHAANGARIERFYYCPYHPEGTVKAYRREHPNRKPQPGMLLQAARDLNLDLSQSWMVGDQMRDIAAGAAAGTRTILLTGAQPAEVSPRKGRKADQPAPPADDATGVKPDFIAQSLVEAVRIIAQHRKPDSGEDRPAPVASTGRRWDAAAVARLQEAQTKTESRGQAVEGREEEKQEEKIDRRGAEAQKKVEDSPRPQPPGTPGKGQPTTEGAEDSSRLRNSPPAPRNDPQNKQEAGVRSQAAGDGEQASIDRDARAASPISLTAPSQPRVQPAQPAEPIVPAQASDEPAEEQIEQTLKLILQELRGQRGRGQEFSYLHVLAIVLQMIAGVCLLGALWMGATDANLFWRWLGAGVILQGATIAVLLFAQRW